MRFSRFLLFMIFALLLMGAGCKEEKKVDVAASLNPERMATMTTKNVSTLISDSGVIQYKIVSPIWKVFDQVDTLIFEGLRSKGVTLRHKDGGREVHMEFGQFPMIAFWTMGGVNAP